MKDSPDLNLDGRLFLRRLPYQPVALYAAFDLLAWPVSRAFPFLSGAACAGLSRQTLAAATYALLVILVTPPLTVATYLFFARRRLENRLHRGVADLSLILIVVVGLIHAGLMTRAIVGQWSSLRSSLVVLRDACWK